jgi:hypothetical protein
MTPATSPQSKRWFLPAIVLVLGGLLTLWLQIYTRSGVFFSGDAGLKAMLAQQFARGNWHADLRLTDLAWVKQIWQAGLYPFTPPFAYAVGDQYFITFPFTFPAVTAPFYALFGYHGLYVVPLVTLWLLWWRFYRLALRMALHPAAIALSLVGLVLASPLVPYAAMYWEHTLAVLLAFWGFTMVLFPKGALVGDVAVGESVVYKPTTLALIGGGVLIGLAVWFRPEFLCFVAALSVVAGLSWLKPGWFSGLKLSFSGVVALVAAMAVTVAIFFGINQALYGHPLGIHAIQIVEESSLKQQILQAKESYQQLLTSLFRYFPITLMAIAIPALPWFERTFKLSAQTRFMLLVGLLFVLAVPLIIPPGAGGKQWGPRFYLIVVPMIMLALAPVFDAFWNTRGNQKKVALAVAAIFLAVGLHMNVINNFRNYRDSQTQSTSLVHNFSPIAPAVVALGKTNQPWVATSHQYVAQQLWPNNPEKTFFLTETPESTLQLAEALVAQNITEFLYICYPSKPCPTPEMPASALSFTAKTNPGQKNELVFKSAGTFGKYPFYDVVIQPE